MIFLSGLFNNYSTAVTLDMRWRIANEARIDKVRNRNHHTFLRSQKKGRLQSGFISHFLFVTQTGARERIGHARKNVRVFCLVRDLLAFSPSAYYAGWVTFYAYRIYSIKRPGRLLNFWTLRVGAYSRWALIRGWAFIKFSPFSASNKFILQQNNK